MDTFIHAARSPRRNWHPLRRLAAVGLTGVCSVGLGGCDRRELPHRLSEPIVVQDVWMRAVDSGGVGGVYLTLTNTDTTATNIVGISTPLADRSTLHETIQDNGVTRMVARPNYSVAAGASVRLVPGGLHIMLEPMTRAVGTGDSLELHITFANGFRLPVQVPVRPLVPGR